MVGNQHRVPDLIQTHKFLIQFVLMEIYYKVGTIQIIFNKKAQTSIKAYIYIYIYIKNKINKSLPSPI